MRLARQIRWTGRPGGSIVARYQHCSTKRALWQLSTTLIPYFLLWYVMYHAMEVSLWLTIPLARTGGRLAGAHVHHLSRLRPRLVLQLAPRQRHRRLHRPALLTFTPYEHWRWQHAIHHGTAGHLDKRGTGDIWTMTVQEYLEASRWRRFAYRLARNPLVLFVLAPLYVFLIGHRFPAAERRPRDSAAPCWWMNLVSLGAAVVLSWIFGCRAVSADPVDRHAGGGRRRHLALLRAASVRRRLLGARRELGLHGGGTARQLLLQVAAACCNGSPPTSASTTSTT